MMENNQYLIEDLKSVVETKLPWEKLENKSVFVTGATGLVGSLCVKMLLMLNQEKHTNTKILAFVRNENKAKDLYKEWIGNENLIFVIGDLNKPMTVEEDVDYIIHGAAITTSKIMVERPVDTILTSITGTKNVLDLAVEKNVSSVVYLSSMEMYGTFDDEKGPVKEEDLGYIDIKNIRSNYPESKRMCENMCVAYHSQYGVPVKIARLAQTFGPGILPGENRVFAQFARSAMKGEDIVLHTKGLSEGNYCYSADALKGIFTILFLGQDTESYNVCNEETHTTIADMAKMVLENFTDGSAKVVFDIPKENTFGYAKDTKMSLDSSKLRALGWAPSTDLRGAYERLIGSLQE